MLGCHQKVKALERSRPLRNLEEGLVECLSFTSRNGLTNLGHFKETNIRYTRCSETLLCVLAPEPLHTRTSFLQLFLRDHAVIIPWRTTCGHHRTCCSQAGRPEPAYTDNITTSPKVKFLSNCCSEFCKSMLKSMLRTLLRLLEGWSQTSFPTSSSW